MISDRDRQILDFEEQHPTVSAARSDLITTQLRMTDTRYTQRLLALVVMPEVVEAYPQLAKRVQESAREHARKRAERSL